MRLGDRALVRSQDDLGLFVVDVQRTEDQDQSRERRVRRDRLEPIVVQVEQDHLRLSGPEDEISELFNLHGCLEGQLQLGSLDDNVGEIEQVDFERVQHSLSGDDDLLGLFFDGQRSNQRGDFFGSLPLGQLTETLLTGPNAGVNDLQEQLSGSRVEDEDGSVDGLGGQVTLERSVNGDSVDVGIVDEPDDLVREQLRVVLRRQVWLGSFGRVELETLSDTLSHDEQSRVGLHDLGHGLGDQGLQTGEEVSESRVQVIGQVDGEQQSGRRGVDRHRVAGVVQELGTGVSLNVMRVVVSPSELHVDPELVACHRAIIVVPGVRQ